MNPTNAEIPGESKLFLGLSSEGNYGWGVCSKYLIRELAKLTCCEVLEPSQPVDKIQHLDGKLFQALTGIDLFSLCGDITGKENYGYTFFEDELTPLSSENAKKYDQVLAGSTWCRDRLREKEIHNCDILLQGIDPKIFYPLADEKERDGFVIFSGGKFELRKGQDLVLGAIKILQQKYPDIFLVNCWYNNWPQLVKTMAASKYMQFDYQDAAWPVLMNRVYSMNGLDPNRIKTFELVPYEMQREIYARTDLGIFPNRCEGGTNLVLMEYMACGKPVIVANTSGHKDIVNADNALLLNDLREFNLFGSDNKLIARWQEPSLEELVAQIEYAYHNRDALKQIANKAGQDLKKFTWEKTARQLIRLIGIY
jgi:glycosyltransferase involved in cell wall biosynthesis